MVGRRLLLATLLVAGGISAAIVLVLSRVSGHESAKGRGTRPSVTINAPATTPAWLVRLASQKARKVSKSAPTTGVIERRRLAYEVRLRGDFTWLACDPCAKRGPLPVAIRDSIVFRVDPELRRVVMTSGPPSLMQ